MKKDILLLLPGTIYINRPLRNQDIGAKPEEFNLYFRNLLLPYDPRWDIRVNCKYGQNLGDCWRLADHADGEDAFDLEIAVYDEYGERIASGKSRVEMVERKPHAPETTVLAVGDSMTRAQTYMECVLKKLYHVKTVGTRRFNNMAHEGRGGWAYKQYLTCFTSVWGGVSPFLFPEGVEDYYGNKEFMDIIADPARPTYAYDGFTFEPIRDGQYFTENGKLYRFLDGKNVLISESPVFKPDFAKYLARNRLPKPDVVSILMGANDLQLCSYEEAPEKIEQYIKDTTAMVDMIRRADARIKIIINLPVSGAGQYAWGMQLGCTGSEKAYRYTVMHACGRLLETFDGRQSENLFICPMALCLDPQNGFDSAPVKANLHAAATEMRQTNWVHPNTAGYYQMGDALASVIEFVR